MELSGGSVTVSVSCVFPVASGCEGAGAGAGAAGAGTSGGAGVDLVAQPNTNTESITIRDSPPVKNLTDLLGLKFVTSLCVLFWFLSC